MAENLTPEQLLERVKADLANNQREETLAKTLSQLEQDMAQIRKDSAEIATFIRTLKWWGPILIAALLGSDTFSELIRSRVEGIGQSTPIEQPIEQTQIPTAAIRQEP